jgi:Fe-S cluster assembly iron-binding protein IscA
LALINVTDDAAGRIQDLLGKEGKQETHGLRMKVIGGG